MFTNINTGVEATRNAFTLVLTYADEAMSMVVIFVTDDTFTPEEALELWLALRVLGTAETRPTNNWVRKLALLPVRGLSPSL